MAKRLIESLSGVGAIYAGDVLMRTVPYELSLWSDDAPPASGGRDRIASIDGHIDITGIGEATVLAGPSSLTLVLQDGRRLPFKLTTTGGGIVGIGDLQ